MTRLGLATMWLHGWLNSGKAGAPTMPASIQPSSWQDIHRRDTAWLARDRNQPEGMGRPPEKWVRQNAALIHLLRTGQWQPVPSSPPDRWVERLTREFSGVTPGAAHKLLTAAISAIPDPAKAILPEPLSVDEREWVKRNSTMVRELSEGQLRGIPASPSRAWIAAFQSAVGGTRSEIAAMLAIIVNVACDAGSTVVAGD